MTFAEDDEWQVVTASAEEIAAVGAEPGALYRVFGDDVRAALRLAAPSVVPLCFGMHWLLSGEIPGDSGPITPLVFLERGGLAIDLRVQLIGFGAGTLDADVPIQPSQGVGEQIATALAAHGLQVAWGGSAKSAIVVQMAWHCRPRRPARALRA